MIKIKIRIILRVRVEVTFSVSVFTGVIVAGLEHMSCIQYIMYCLKDTKNGKVTSQLKTQWQCHKSSELIIFNAAEIFFQYLTRTNVNALEACYSYNNKLCFNVTGNLDRNYDNGLSGCPIHCDARGSTSEVHVLKETTDIS